jgi:hypothetical protein
MHACETNDLPLATLLRFYQLKKSNWHTDLEFVRIQVYPDDPLGSSHPGPLRYLQFIGSGIAVMNSRHPVQWMIHPSQRTDHHATDYIVHTK